VTDYEATIEAARARRDARDAAYKPIDYAAMNRAYPRQKAALTRAVNSGDGAWPDGWARWQNALDDALPWNDRVELGDLR
jgi:hypothetical protein